MLDLIKAISLGLVVLLPLANPLTTVALFLGLAGNMNSAERNHQSMMASVYVRRKEVPFEPDRTPVPTDLYIAGGR